MEAGYGAGDAGTLSRAFVAGHPSRQSGLPPESLGSTGLLLCGSGVPASMNGVSGCRLVQSSTRVSDWSNEPSMCADDDFETHSPFSHLIRQARTWSVKRWKWLRRVSLFPGGFSRVTYLYRGFCLLREITSRARLSNRPANASKYLANP